MTDNALARLSAATLALAEAKTLDEIKQVRDVAVAAQTYARAAKLGLEAQNHAAEVKLRAERRAGELLAQLERDNGGRPSTNSFHDGTSLSEYRTVLTENEIAPTTAHRWQTIAALPDEVFEETIAETVAARKELTTASVLGVAKKVAREEWTPQKHAANTTIAERQPQLYVANAESMPMIPDGTVDLIITSPPYNLGQSNWPMGGDGRLSRDTGIGYRSHSDELEEDEYQAWQIEVLKELYRVARPGASLFYNHKIRNRDGVAIHPVSWVTRGEWTLRQEIIWDRGSTHNHNPSLFWPEDERVYWLTKGRPTLPDHPIGMSTIWRFHGPVANTWHPAPFAGELPDRVLQAVGVPGATVLDPFAGSCTTLVAALAYGCAAIGVDKEASYLERAAAENGWTNVKRI